MFDKSASWEELEDGVCPGGLRSGPGDVALAGAVTLPPPPTPQAGVGLDLRLRLIQLLAKFAHGLCCPLSLVVMYLVVFLEQKRVN